MINPGSFESNKKDKQPSALRLAGRMPLLFGETAMTVVLTGYAILGFTQINEARNHRLTEVHGLPATDFINGASPERIETGELLIGIIGNAAAAASITLSLAKRLSQHRPN